MKTLHRCYWYNVMQQRSKLGDFMRASAEDRTEKYDIASGKASVQFVRKAGVVPRTAVPWVLNKEHDGNTHDKTIVYADMSGIRDGEFDLRYMNAILTAAYLEEDINQGLNDLNNFACRAYVNWISRLLAGKLAMHIEDQYHMEILLAAFYLIDGKSVDEYLKTTRLEVLASRIAASCTNIREDVIIRRLMSTKAFDDSKTELFNYPMLVSEIRAISTELEAKVDINSIFTAVSGSLGIFGQSGQAMAALAVEFRPSFITILYRAAVDKMMTKTTFGRVFDDYTAARNRHTVDSFARQVHGMVRDLEVKQE